MDHTVATGTNSQPGGMGGHFRRGHAAALLLRSLGTQSAKPAGHEASPTAHSQ